MSLFKTIIASSVFLFSINSSALTVDINQCFDSFLDKSVDGRFDGIRACVKLYRQQQPLSVPEAKFTYSQYHNENENIMSLEYIAAENISGINLDSLKQLITKSKNIVESNHCKGDYPLGRVWCSKFKRLASLPLPEAQIAEKENNILNISFDSDEEHLAHLFKMCSSEGNPYCDDGCNVTKLSNKNTPERESFFCSSNFSSEFTRKCYSSRDKRMCRIACTDGQHSEDYFTCMIGNGETLVSLGGLRAKNSFNSDKDDSSPKHINDISSASFSQPVPTVRPQPSRESVNPAISNNGESTLTKEEYEQLKNDPYFSVGLRASQNIDDQYNQYESSRSRVDTSNINIPNIDVSSKSSVGGFDSDSTSYSGSLSTTLNNPSLASSSLLPINSGKTQKRLNKAQKRVVRQSRSHPASQPLGQVSNVNRLKKNTEKARRVSQEMPYKKYRDNLGGHVYYGVDGQKDVRTRENGVKKNKKSKNSKKRRHSSLPDPSEIMRLKEGFRYGSTSVSPLLGHQNSIFKSLNFIYNDIKKDGVLDENGY